MGVAVVAAAAVAATVAVAVNLVVVAGFIVLGAAICTQRETQWSPVCGIFF